MKNSILFVSLILSIILIAGCAQTAENKNVQQNGKTITPPPKDTGTGSTRAHIKIAVAGSWADWTPLFVAQEKGIFKKNNVNIEILFREDYSQALYGLYVGGDADGVVELTQDTIVHNTDDQTPTKIVYVLDHFVSGDAIVGKANSIADLKGKRIGGSTGPGALLTGRDLL